MISVRLSKARGLNVALAAYALARLRVLEHRILSINLVLSLEVVGVGGGPAAIQGRSDVVVFHLDPRRRRCVNFKDGTLSELQLSPSMLSRRAQHDGHPAPRQDDEALRVVALLDDLHT